LARFRGLINQLLCCLQICGTIKGEKGIQRAEAMLHAIDRINKDTTLLPGITLGCQILDTCLRDTYALEQALEFIRPYMSSLSNEVQLCGDGNPPSQDASQQQLKPIAGVVGASASVVSVMVANMLQLFKVRRNLTVIHGRLHCINAGANAPEQFQGECFARDRAESQYSSL